MKIKSVTPKEIKDSRGNPTVEVEIETSKGTFFGACPSGASKGSHEAVELRDEDGKGVSKAISNIKKIIAPKLKSGDFNSQEEIDKLLIDLDETKNKSNLGVNAILPVSIACCRALAAEEKMPVYGYVKKIYGDRSEYVLPKPCFNIIEGGAHAKNKLDVQEFMVIPQKGSFRENFMVASEIYRKLQEVIQKNFGELGQGDEGGFAPQITKTEQALFALKSAIEIHPETKFGLDVAATQLYKDDKYEFEGQTLNHVEMVEFYKDIISRFPIAFIEDPFAEEDWLGFEMITKEFIKIGGGNVKQSVRILGDDLTTTNIERIKEAKGKNACNGVIIKLNQIGTVTETLEAAKLARLSDWKILVSHRSGETMDTFIADLAAGINADYIKSGAPTAQERMVKYNRLMEIEAELNPRKK